MVVVLFRVCSEMLCLLHAQQICKPHKIKIIGVNLSSPHLPSLWLVDLCADCFGPQEKWHLKEIQEACVCGRAYPYCTVNCDWILNLSSSVTSWPPWSSQGKIPCILNRNLLTETCWKAFFPPSTDTEEGGKVEIWKVEIWSQNVICLQKHGFDYFLSFSLQKLFMIMVDKRTYKRTPYEC